MINRVDISNVIPFQNTQSLDDLKKFNYFFGANGTGKTTISKVLNAPDDYSSSCITWEKLNPLEIRVYNRDFVDGNFNQNLKGVFTLGEMAKETLEKINVTKEEIKKSKEVIDSLNNTLQGTDGNGGKKSELSNLTQTYKAKFYKMKQKHSDKLSGTQSGEGMRGFIGSQDAFMDKVMAESTSNMATLLLQAELEEKAKTVFSNTLVTVDPLIEKAYCRQG